MEDKTAIMARVKALLAKTQAAGCSEEEADAAVTKARELIAKYQIDMTEKELVAEGFAEIVMHWKSRARYDIEVSLCVRVAEYTGTHVCRIPGLTKTRQGLQYFGLESDVQFAEWLLIALADFVERNGREYRSKRAEQLSAAYDSPVATVTRVCKSQLADAEKSFAMGCYGRINKRLKEATTQTVQVKAATGTALVLLDKHALVRAEMQRRGRHIAKYRNGGGNRIIRSASAYQEGQAVGDRANFSKPIGQSTTRAIGRA